jgi:hypothetical protein
MATSIEIGKLADKIEAVHFNRGSDAVARYVLRREAGYRKSIAALSARLASRNEAIAALTQKLAKKGTKQR